MFLLCTNWIATVTKFSGLLPPCIYTQPPPISMAVYHSSGKFIGLVHNPYCLCRYVASMGGPRLGSVSVKTFSYNNLILLTYLRTIEHQVKLADYTIAPRAYLLHIDGFAKTFHFLGVLALMILISAMVSCNLEIDRLLFRACVLAFPTSCLSFSSSL